MRSHFEDAYQEERDARVGSELGDDASGESVERLERALLDLVNRSVGRLGGGGDEGGENGSEGVHGES